MKEDICCLQSKDIKTPANQLFKHNFQSSDTCGSPRKDFSQFLVHLWQELVRKILVNSQELQVWQKVDRYGNKYWQAYDPRTGKSFTSGSETDISMWIEQLYRY